MNTLLTNSKTTEEYDIRQSWLDNFFLAVAYWHKINDTVYTFAREKRHVKY